jgi:hypothetical protein
MKKWMIFMREGDGMHFLWNGSYPVGISPNSGDEGCWHARGEDIPETEKTLLNDMVNSRARGFTIPEHGRYQVVARGPFKEL